MPRKAKAHTIARRRRTMRKIKYETFEKISVKKTVKKDKRDDWKRDRQALRKAKRNIQEKNFA